MFDLLWLIPALPLAGFALLVILGPALRGRWPGIIGTGAVAASAVVAAMLAWSFLTGAPEGGFFVQRLWDWIPVGSFAPQVALRLDALSLLMICTVTFVASLIQLYSIEFMQDDEGYARYFAYMCLFVAAMLLLVLADNMVLLYVGWEGVGLCSYLLIGFWYKDSANGYAARKAFITTRVGDTAFVIGLLLLFTQLGTLDIQQTMQQAQATWAVDSPMAIAAALLLLGGAIGKSAQVPLHVWLPDAMAGPTPVSALIHSATMVTAGVYLVARTNALFVLAPTAQTVVLIVGTVTMLYAGLCALGQHDIKRVLAYSTISQVGLMFVALGIGAPAAAMFHFAMHAFFKPLLFLGAGAVILAMHHEHDIRRMGGLRRELPLTFWTFLIGSAALSALPLVTAGFYSKDLIIDLTLMSSSGGLWLWLAMLAGAVLTTLYSLRVVFLVFFGQATRPIARRPGWAMSLPLIVLATLSIAGGAIQWPLGSGESGSFTSFLRLALPTWDAHAGHQAPWDARLLAAGITILSFALAWVLFAGKRQWLTNLTAGSIGRQLARAAEFGFGFDWAYDRMLVRPIVALAHLNRRDFIDRIFDALAWVTAFGNRVMSHAQTGNLRWYAGSIAAGAVIVIAIMVLL